MSIDDLVNEVTALGGVLTLRPGPGDGSPEISWGDVFFYYAPDGEVPKTQPFATIVTKDYPDDLGARLHRPGAFRLNIAAGTAAFDDLFGYEPRAAAITEDDPSPPDDTVIPHPTYGELGWVAVTNPGDHTADRVRELLTSAHRAARARYERRTGQSAG